MTNIIDYFEKNKIFISFEYYGINDFGTGFDIKTILDNKEVFENFYNAFPLCEVKSIEEYLLYLLTNKFTKLEEIIPNINDENNQEIIRKLVFDAKSILEKISTGDLIRFINSNYYKLFDENLYTYDVPFLTLEIIVKYIKGIDNSVIEFLIDNHNYMIINNFDKFEKWFEKNPECFNKLFPTGKIKHYDMIHLDVVLDIWKHIYNKEKSNLKRFLNKNIKEMYDDVEQLAKSSTSESIMRDETIIRIFNLFLISIRSPLANSFSDYVNTSKALLSDYIKKNGHIFKYEVPVKEIIEHWKKIPDWQTRLLYITHEPVEENNNKDIVSKFSLIKHRNGHFVDFGSSNVRHNKYFTISFQEELKIHMDCNSAIFHGFLFDNVLLEEYIASVLSVTKYMEKNIYGENILEDTEFLFYNINLLASNITNPDEETIQVLCYSASMYICSLSEKLLRVFYKYLEKDVRYIPVEKATLGDLLTINNEPLKKVFGEKHIKILAYYLLKDKPNDVGHNLRNSLAHWSGLSKNNMNVSLVEHLLYIYTDILNTIFLYFLKENDAEESE